MAIKFRLKKPIVDALLIIFSVLLALMINKSFEAWQVSKQRQAALVAKIKIRTRQQ
jgi:hypothetical protein